MQNDVLKFGLECFMTALIIITGEIPRGDPDEMRLKVLSGIISAWSIILLTRSMLVKSSKILLNLKFSALTF